MYDIIVIGGGIAGLYTTYKIHKRNPGTRVLLIEKENRIGGRIHTYKDQFMTVEAGAGRINGSQPLIMNLINELGLTSKLHKNNGNAVFRPADYTESIESSVSNAPQSSNNPIINNVIDITLGPETLPNASLILYLVAISKTYSKQYLQNHTLSQYAQQVLTKQQVTFIKQSFGYYSELVIMNAYDAIKLLILLGPNNTFYGMNDGIEQIIEKMEALINRNPNITLLKSKEVTKIVYRERIFDVYQNNTKYECVKCICALPKPALLKLPIFKSIRSLINKVECGTLCRIYSQFDVDPKTNRVWFANMEKFTTDNDLRMVIPYNKKERTIMMSYSDNIFADKWKKMYEDKGVRTVNKKLQDDMLESIGKHIPTPKNTKLFYWECGVGYWTPGADSKKIAEKMIKPFSNMPLFICGENYSENGQQWMEGALETSEEVLSRL